MKRLIIQNKENLSGLSNPAGILLTDERDPCRRSVYITRKDQVVQAHIGSRAEVKRLWDADQAEAAGEENIIPGIATLIMLYIAGVCLLIWLKAGSYIWAGYAVFVIMSYQPMRHMMFMGANLFRTEEQFAQMKRNHGAEHMVINYVRHRDTPGGERPPGSKETSRGRTWNPEEIRKYGFLAPNCGNVEAGLKLTVSVLSGITVGIFPVLGWSRIVIFAAVWLGILGIGGIAGHPVLRYLQLPQVEDPGEEELALAEAGMRMLLEDIAPLDKSTGKE